MLTSTCVGQGYWKDEAATAKVRATHQVDCKGRVTDMIIQAITKDGYMLTGDLGVMDSEGFLYIRDRRASLFVYNVLVHSSTERIMQ